MTIAHSEVTIDGRCPRHGVLVSVDSACQSCLWESSESMNEAPPAMQPVSQASGDLPSAGPGQASEGSRPLPAVPSVDDRLAALPLGYSGEPGRRRFKVVDAATGVYHVADETPYEGLIALQRRARQELDSLIHEARRQKESDLVLAQIVAELQASPTFRTWLDGIIADALTRRMNGN